MSVRKLSLNLVRQEMLIDHHLQFEQDKIFPTKNLRFELVMIRLDALDDPRLTDYRSLKSTNLTRWSNR
ncbi:MAG: hypothetical protein KDA84_19510, partial [Planctomycetaceae bacterium]|nr:hypothetical protein [Planctomycetaceae bacterium]